MTIDPESSFAKKTALFRKLGAVTLNTPNDGFFYNDSGGRT